MMSIPPSGGGSGTPPSGESGQSKKKDKSKPFKLPDRKGKVDAKKEDEKKKGLFDLAGDQVFVQEQRQDIQQELKAGDVKAEQIAGTEAKVQMSQVSQLVQKLVESMRIGQVDGKDFASLNLKSSAEVPEAFAGSNLTMSYQAGSLTIHFDNFMTPQQENNAVVLVEKQKEQLEQMVKNLQAKNIQVTELTIGNHVVTLPEVQPLPPPFQPTPTSEAETQQQREGRGEGEEGGGKEAEE